MKIHQIPEGTRFLYEGEEYVKSGPMFATGSKGRRLIPKYAILQPLDPAVAQTKEMRIVRRAVIDAFDRFCMDCKPLVPEARCAEFDAARQRFIDSVS